MEELPDIYYLKKWRELYCQKENNGTSGEYKLENEYGIIIYPYIRRQIQNEKKYCDIITPYGFNGPIILECKDREKLIKSFEQDFNEYCKDNGIIAEYIRFSPWFKNHLDFKDYYDLKIREKTYEINLLVDDILMQEISSRRRNKIRNSIKAGVRVEFDNEGKTIDDFYRLYQNTIKKNNIEEYYWVSKEFLKEHFKYLKNNVFFANAIYEDKIISSSMILHYNKQIHYHYSANDYQYGKLNANSLILYEVAKWGKEHGKQHFDLGGVSGSEKLIEFKLTFSKSKGLDYYVGTRIRQKEIYDELVRKTKTENSNYFPKYRG